MLALLKILLTSLPRLLRMLQSRVGQVTGVVFVRIHDIARRLLFNRIQCCLVSALGRVKNTAAKYRSIVPDVLYGRICGLLNTLLRRRIFSEGKLIPQLVADRRSL